MERQLVSRMRSRDELQAVNARLHSEVKLLRQELTVANGLVAGLRVKVKMLEEKLVSVTSIPALVDASLSGGHSIDMTTHKIKLVGPVSELEECTKRLEKFKQVALHYRGKSKVAEKELDKYKEMHQKNLKELASGRTEIECLRTAVKVWEKETRENQFKFMRERSKREMEVREKEQWMREKEREKERWMKEKEREMNQRKEKWRESVKSAENMWKEILWGALGT